MPADFSSEGTIARRPTIFRALGQDDPPETIEIDGREYRRTRMLKHDSWAASASYCDVRGHRIACKFNRVQPIVLVPMRWLGRRLARRESGVLRLVAHVEGFPRLAGAVMRAPNAVAHEWIDGETFKPWLHVDDLFFPRLLALITTLHRLGIAYVDMPKWENILVGTDGRPYLLDYQIHFRPRGPLMRPWLKPLQAADLYYLRRQWLRTRPDQVSQADRKTWTRQPFIVRVGEALGVRWLRLRLLILVRFGVHGDPRRTIS